MNYLGLIHVLPSSKTIGVLSHFDHDDSIEDEIYDLFYKMVEKEINKKFPPANCPPYDWRDPQKMETYRKWSVGQWDLRTNLQGRKTNESKALWKIAKEKVENKPKEVISYVKFQAKLDKSKYELLLAVTNQTFQKKAGAMLKKLGFSVVLKFTNPNHDRVDDLLLWLRPKK
jgi:FMN phosphatase YigB (HAD superfamily)